MRQGKVILGRQTPSLLMAGMLLVGVSGVAQTKPATVPDAQIEANVLKSLASRPQLADQAISTTTVYGTVTISGSVRDEASRNMAEDVVSKTVGVQKVVDELAIGGGSSAAAVNPAPQGQDSVAAVNAAPQGQDSGEVGTNPNLQSDGTIAQSAPAQPMQGQDPGVAPQPQQEAGNQQPMQQPPQQPMQSGQPAQPMQPAPPAPPYGPYRQPYPAYPGPYGQQPGYAAQPVPPAQPLIAQRGGDAVIVPAGAVIHVRINEAMDSKKTAPGTVFDGVVLNNIVAGGAIAIPRGAFIQGVVADAHRGGQLTGQGGLSLQLTQVTLGDRTYPLVSDLWSERGASKTGNTVNNTVGMSAVGALIGAVAGGGVGAAVGAGVGGIAGLGVSSASRRGEAAMPAEAIVDFRLTQPMELTTVSQAELNRLGAGLPPQQGQPPQMLQRRYPPPPPPGYYPYYPQYRY